MKQIVIASGKGGTGKTVITGAFAALAENKVMADCDVDAADLHLILKPSVKEKHIFKSGKTAFIDKTKCTKCGKCVKLCRFSAISDSYIVDGISCEGCAFCAFACPADAIEMKENVAGEWFVSDTRFGSMVHAKLGIAEENSGKLVSVVRKRARELAQETNADWVIVDGAPGIGCAVIASFSGADCAVIVTEPTLSGLHDADRVIRVAKHFGILVKVIVNKYDLNEDMTKKIEEYCKKNEITLLGKIPFDKCVVESMVAGKTILEHESGIARKPVIAAWRKLLKEIG
ncbi:MAG: ATP-binding protein [Candidatus Omnitrophica bacterium]|nr:ATP-binding protein [Candidatus Omnitrophota bacterium]